MRTKLPIRSFLCLLAAGGSLLPATAQIPWATDYFSRQGKAEVYGIGQYLHQGDTTFSGPNGQTTKMNLDDTGLGGFGMAYHFNDFLAIHGDFMFGPATFRSQTGNGPSYEVGDSGFIQTGRVNLDYNIINRRITPFVTAGIGWQYFEINQDYYYYPYYYYGNYYYETDFTWNVGAGVRWNVLDNLVVKLTGGAQWLKYSGADNITTQIEAFLAVGWTFP